MKDRIFYRDQRGVVVTQRYVRTRHKDQALAPITSVRIGRDAFYLALACGAGLALFAWAFGDLLFFAEQVGLAGFAVVVLAAGYSLATLEMGTHLHEKRMLVGDYWSVRRIRDAVMDARRDLTDRMDEGEGHRAMHRNPDDDGPV
ncbi:hypothetical protein [Bosea caraganae]|nr:hypothetical protein [Bosea caraganae]